MTNWKARPDATCGSRLLPEAGIAALRAFSLHLPPALAIGLLPQVIPHPGWGFVIAVAAGTLVLTGTFLFIRPLLLGRPDVASAG